MTSMTSCWLCSNVVNNISRNFFSFQSNVYSPKHHKGRNHHTCCCVKVVPVGKKLIFHMWNIGIFFTNKSPQFTSIYILFQKLVVHINLDIYVFILNIRPSRQKHISSMFCVCVLITRFFSTKYETHTQNFIIICREQKKTYLSQTLTNFIILNKR